MSDTTEIKILLVEDDELDIIGIQRALKKLRILNPLIVAKDGVQALELLRGTDSTPKIQGPFVIILDINMPRMDGIEFLNELRADSELNETMVFILTVSSEDDDIYRAYKQNVVGYIVKSDPVKSLENAFKLIDCDWLMIDTPNEDQPKP